MKKNISAFDYALKVISIRDHSEKEIIQKALSKGYALKDVRVAVKKLKEYHYIDDEKFAAMFARSRYAEGKAGNLIKSELLKKGIEPEVVIETLSKIKPSDESEIETAFTLAQKRYNKKHDWKKNSQRISAFLARRGFKWSIIEKALGQISEVKKDVYQTD